MLTPLFETMHTFQSYLMHNSSIPPKDYRILESRRAHIPTLTVLPHMHTYIHEDHPVRLASTLYTTLLGGGGVQEWYKGILKFSSTSTIA